MTVDPEQARKRVMDEKARVEGLIHNLKDGLGDGPESDELSELSDYDQHPADSATETFERERDLAIEDNAQVILRETEAALKKIADGTYGTCERCGKMISEARLKAIPYTPYCIECAEWLSGR